MKNNTKNQATALGLRFTIVSALLTLTFIVPILTVLPSAFLEGFIASIIDSEPYSNVGKTTLFVLSLLFLSSLVLIIFIVRKITRKSQLSYGTLILIMLVEFPIVHSLGLYIYWGLRLGFKCDGQLMFAVFASFPVSSLSFVLIGWLIDFVKINKPASLLEA